MLENLSRKQVYIIVAGILLLAVIATGVFWYLAQQRVEIEEKIPEPEKDLIEQIEQTTAPSEYTWCSNIYTDDPVSEELEELSRGLYRSDYNGSDVGSVNVRGDIVKKEEDIFDSKITRIYIAIDTENNDKDMEEFYTYNMDRVNEGNSVNRKEGDILWFAIGKLNENGSFDSSASVSEDTKSLIENSIDINKVLDFRLRMTTTGDGYAPFDFSFACAIDKL